MTRWIAICFFSLMVFSAVAEPIKVACIGDSITYGSGLKRRGVESYPAQLQKLLGKDYEVRNFSSPGRGIFRHSMRGKEKRGFIFMSQHQRALEWQPDIVICNLGINDCGEYVKQVVEEGKKDLFVEDYCALLQEYQLLPTRPKIFIWTKLSPLAPGQNFYKSAEPFLMQYDLERVADLMGAVGIDMQTPLLPICRTHIPDKIHPDAVGAKLIATTTHAAIKPYLTDDIPFSLPFFFGDDMVLPSRVPFTVRGTAKPGSLVVCDGKAVRADWRGVWAMKFPPRQPSTMPRTLTFKAGEENVTLKNVLYGDVWICAGQSNMLWPLNQCDRRDEFKEEATDPAFRFLAWDCALHTDPGAWDEKMIALSKTPDTFSGKWAVVDKTNVGGFSGIGVMFGQGLRNARPRVPIGVIQIAVGGAPVEAFLPRWAMAGKEDLLSMVTPRIPWYDIPDFPARWCQDRAKGNMRKGMNQPDAETMVHPFAPEMIWERAFAPLFFAQGGGDAFPAKGVIWYQGESNATTNMGPNLPLKEGYMKAGLATLIETLRNEKNLANLPVIQVQLPKMNRFWMLFRSLQDAIARDGTYGNVGLVVTTDTGSPNDVHPRDKWKVAARCVNEALRIAYNDGSVPAFTFAEKITPSEDGVLIELSGPALAPEIGINGFEIKPAESQAFTKPASVVRKNDREIFVRGRTAAISAIQYNWMPVPLGSLTNIHGLPVAPFSFTLEVEETDKDEQP